MRKSVAPALALIQLGFLAACGGGGYGRGTTTPPPPTQMIATPGPPNVETLTVDAGPTGGVNTAFVSVQICVPGTMTCQTIDHIEVDTGSTGLRILADVPFTLTLPQATNGSGGPPMTECLQFADGSSYGSLRVAYITLPGSGEHAANVIVQLIGDSTYPVPTGTITGQSACPGITENTVQAFGANGILGVGPFAQDCGGGCAAPNPPLAGVYYNCASPSTCVDANASLTEQVANPVSMFTTDNNGVIVELPAVGAAGITTVSGSLVFGIGTRTNNALGMATVLPEDPNSGFITATYKGIAYAAGYIDSGSNGNFFTDSSLTQCTTATGFYCPASTMSESATLQGTTATMLAADFSVANAETLFSNASYTAFSNLAGTIPNPPPPPQAQPFDLGLPFFYGQNVFTAIEGNTVSGTMGPFFAY